MRRCLGSPSDAGDHTRGPEPAEPNESVQRRPGEAARRAVITLENGRHSSNRLTRPGYPPLAAGLGPPRGAGNTVRLLPFALRDRVGVRRTEFIPFRLITSDRGVLELKKNGMNSVLPYGENDARSQLSIQSAR
jgi:hypothetical protein